MMHCPVSPAAPTRRVIFSPSSTAGSSAVNASSPESSSLIVMVILPPRRTGCAFRNSEMSNVSSGSICSLSTIVTSKAFFFVPASIVTLPGAFW